MTKKSNKTANKSIIRFTLLTNILGQNCPHKKKIPVSVFLLADKVNFGIDSKKKLYDAVAIYNKNQTIVKIYMTLLRFITFYFLKFKTDYRLEIRYIQSLNAKKSEI